MRTLCAPLSALYYTDLAFNIDNADFWCISQTCYFHLCRLLPSTTQTWCHYQTGYCFHTCPSWLLQRHPCGSPDVQSTLVPLQWVLHVAIHTMLNLKPLDHVLCTRPYMNSTGFQSRRGYSVSCVCWYTSHVSATLRGICHSYMYWCQSDIPSRSALRSARNSDFDFDVPRSARELSALPHC